MVELSKQAQAAYRLQRYGAETAIEGLLRVPLKRFNDESGSLIELVRPASRAMAGLEGFELRQVNYSCLEPGAVKAFHVHRRQTDIWFVPPEDRVLLVAVDVRAVSATTGKLNRWMLGDGDSALVRIPPGVAHGCRNLGQRRARLIYFTDLEFSADPEQCDEGRLAWDWAGEDVWEIPRQ